MGKKPNNSHISSEALLNKVDRLRELNIAQHVGLPQVNEVMGISMGEDSSNGSVFSEDILKIEICGPEEDYLTIIDVPGIFRVAGGLTTPEDVALVRNIVTKYIKDKRTIILAVIPSNVDIATQEILSLAKEHDPQGERTLGILTKPDLFWRPSP
ncbi:Interferon-induced GTP-binding protein Mx2 [Ceratocystis platani]|uniref:Interferon-induced GTP-binding protein Mx2 n=1 Tax=Ceratocystis fimbriata f. sp. platani TaxID=88771 RepID=A0A0F8BYN6_CERFI|nr:Interferon-induced GTP-binding protein Mx2 [Ceratocystis platani]